VAALFGDDDADLSLVQDRNVAVLGYDDLAAAHALCLRDSGVDVRIGLETRSAMWDEAEADGLRVVGSFEACEEADLVVLPVTLDGLAVDEVVTPTLVAGDVVVLHDSAAAPAGLPAGVDVVRLASWASGAVVREEYAQGRGVPLFASVVVDGSGGAWDLALAYARAIGATRAGVIRTADGEDLGARAEADRALLHGGVLPLVRGTFDALVASGCQPEVAYLCCVHGLRQFAEDLARGLLDAELTQARPAAESAAGPDQVPDPLPAAGSFVRSLMAWERDPGSRLH
jgi:ketol-acid reductoisomerase